MPDDPITWIPIRESERERLRVIAATVRTGDRSDPFYNAWLHDARIADSLATREGISEEEARVVAHTDAEPLGLTIDEAAALRHKLRNPFQETPDGR